MNDTIEVNHYTIRNSTSIPLGTVALIKNWKKVFAFIDRNAKKILIPLTLLFPAIGLIATGAFLIIKYLSCIKYFI